MLWLLLLFLAYTYEHNVIAIETNADIPENKKADLNTCDTQNF